MLVRYYDNDELAYTNRKRYHSFNFKPFFEENNRSVILGDGATTQIKTSSDNICNYVTINDTRWYVTSYVYLNGKQVVLNLQRDVIGEFGIANCFGKIERGYTDSILKNRKELDLNQILKKRIPLKPNSGVYGNYSVDNHNEEMWGILYITKPSEDQIVIPIPSFTPDVVDLDFIENGTIRNKNYSTDIWFGLNIEFSTGNKYAGAIYISYENNSWKLKDVEARYVNYAAGSLKFEINNSLSSNNQQKTALGILANIGNFIISDGNLFGFTFPEIPNLDYIPDYNGITIKKDDDYLQYKTTNITKEVYGNIGNVEKQFELIKTACENQLVFWNGYGQEIGKVSYGDEEFYGFDFSNKIDINCIQYNYTVLDQTERGELLFDFSKQNLIDEPYYILVCPLYNVKISGEKEYNVDKQNAFNVFNEVIQILSGENAYLVDAQIYPYCPILTSVTAEINDIPFFVINSTSYSHICNVQLLPYSDVKKEYIEKQYSIISPDQSGKFSFNFYDYITRIENNNGINYVTIQIEIKTGLKPFSIVSSAIIYRDDDSLIGIKYSSDLNGSQSSGGGFECSLASNAFETYQRQNSNYQQLFELDQQELQRQHQVEKVNETVSAVVNTVTAATMGAIAGGSAAVTFAGSNWGSAAAGAATGAVVAGGVVGGMMGYQAVENDKLRAYEEKLQKERFDLTIGTIKNLPNTISRISSFNEIILQDFYYVIEVYECSDYEKQIVDTFIEQYGYGIGVYDYLVNYHKEGWFLRASIITSNYAVNLHSIAKTELAGGIYYYE